MELENKKILIVGLGISGLAVAEFLIKQGASVKITDSASEDQLTDYLPRIAKMNVSLEIGRHSAESFENADIIVLSPGVPHRIKPIVKARKKGIPVIGEVELASMFIKEPVVAITGTNGKTTTTTLVGKMLEESGRKVFVGGNIGNPLISYVDKYVRQEEKAEIIVAEVSSFQLDTIETFRPKVSVLLNITEDHLDRYSDFEAYARSKSRIFENQNTNDTAILNGSDAYVKKVSEKIDAQKLYFYRKDDFFEERFENYFKTAAWSQNIQSGSLDFLCPGLPGMHNRENICAASLAAAAAGGTPKGIRSALKKFKGLPHRLEYVTTKYDVRFYDDSKATNIDAVARALDAFTEDVILIMGGRDKGGDYNLLKEKVCKHTKKL